MKLKITILHEDCDPKLGDDRTLPYTTYLVYYNLDGQVKTDLVMCKKEVDIFDHYWDHYHHEFIKFVKTEGRSNPRLWVNPNTVKK